MIKAVRAMSVQSAKAREAVIFAKDVAEWLNTHQPGHDVRVFREIFGKNGTIYWTSEVEDLATLERLTAEREGDPEWQALLERAAGLFVPGSTRDTLLRSV
jgi:hypothetical protein